MRSIAANNCFIQLFILVSRRIEKICSCLFYAGLSGSAQVYACGSFDQLDYIVNIEFMHYVTSVDFNSAGGSAEYVGDFLVASAFQYKTQNDSFSSGEWFACKSVRKLRLRQY